MKLLYPLESCACRRLLLVFLLVLCAPFLYAQGGYRRLDAPGVGTGSSSLFNDTSRYDLLNPKVGISLPGQSTLFPEIQPFSVKEIPDVEFPMASFSRGPLSDHVILARPWDGAALYVQGSSQQMPWLMGVDRGALVFRQDLGRLHVVVSGSAGKYFIPMELGLSTQWGVGGTIGYDISDAVSVYAFGNYYTSNPLVGPAFSPFVQTSNYGGYVDVKMGERFGSELGMQRYVDPMSGRWTTEPIVTPYIRVGRSKIEFPVGMMVKSMVMGDRLDPMGHRPVPPPQPKKRK